ncbi:hypothetical protein RIR_jg16113.t1 [Rhizophagus irregularis DAOM 181602=DAOM 197198]|nr:hypothetical protein RIR_jg16113.t1 [Rhizophagus irregularis DAOM 181602=DAOM 197198]
MVNLANRNANFLCNVTVLQGIDQGEVISPLLWNIYYDPMFHRINQLQSLHYTTWATQKRNAQHVDNDLIHSYCTSVVGYLDDTTWFGSSIKQIEEKLSIANSFYDFTNVKINLANTKS